MPKNASLYSQKVARYIPANTKQTANFNKVEDKNPINEPTAAFNAFLASL